MSEVVRHFSWISEKGRSLSPGCSVIVGRHLLAEGKGLIRDGQLTAQLCLGLAGVVRS